MTSTNDAQNDNQSDGGKARSWDDVLGSLGEEDVQLFETHVTGLKNTVKATRDERDALKARVTNILDTFDGKEPSAVKQELEELRTQVTEASTQASFFADAGTPEVGCRNPKIAWLVAKSNKLFDEDGNPKWDDLKQEAPELFGASQASPPPGNAGSGTRDTKPKPANPNDNIRKAAGY